MKACGRVQRLRRLRRAFGMRSTRPRAARWRWYSCSATELRRPRQPLLQLLHRDDVAHRAIRPADPVLVELRPRLPLRTAIWSCGIPRSPVRRLFQNLPGCRSGSVASALCAWKRISGRMSSPVSAASAFAAASEVAAGGVAGGADGLAPVAVGGELSSEPRSSPPPSARRRRRSRDVEACLSREGTCPALRSGGGARGMSEGAKRASVSKERPARASCASSTITIGRCSRRRLASERTGWSVSSILSRSASRASVRCWKRSISTAAS